MHCAGDSADDEARLADTATIGYEYRDASVPPEFHRSYTLSISRDEVAAVVDSYGDVLYDATTPISDDVWERLADTFETVVDLEPDEIEDGCAGGTGRVLVIADGDQTLVDVDVEVCGGENADTADAIDAYVAPVIDAIPNWEDVLGEE